MKTMCWLEKGKSCGFVQIIQKRPVESLNVERLGEPPLVRGLTWVQSNTECIRQTLRGCAETFTLSGSLSAHHFRITGPAKRSRTLTADKHSAHLLATVAQRYTQCCFSSFQTGLKELLTSSMALYLYMLYLL